MPLPPLDPDDCVVAIAAYPTGHVEPRLKDWLHGTHKIPYGMVGTGKIKPLVVAYNQGILKALESGKRHCVFCDHDIWPVDANGNHPGSDEFFGEHDADIICMPCRLGLDGAWASPGAFHAAAWRTTRDVLLKLPPPWFDWTLSPDGAAVMECPCGYFARRAREAGFTVGRAGWGGHAVKTT